MIKQHLYYSPLIKSIPDKVFLKMQYLKTCHARLNLKDPKRFTEKLQWLKLYDRNPLYTKLADKYEVKKIVADKLGEEHVIPLLGVWDKFDDIDFDQLPDQFVLKCTNDSGGYVICKDKGSFDTQAAKEKMEWSRNHNYYYVTREWQYKNIPYRIIAEPFIESLGKPESVEYKMTCMNGKFVFGTICTGKAHAEFCERKNDFYDAEFNFLPFYTTYYLNSGKEYEKPKQWEEMIRYSEMLTKDIPTARVDFYIINEVVIFGEVTFQTWGGFFNFNSIDWDYKWGSTLSLPK